MKHFLVILLGVLPLFAPAQDVTIPADVARFFLEQHDRAILLNKKDSVSRIEITNLSLLVKSKDSIIFSYKSDSLVYRQIISTKDQLTKVIESENKNLTKKVNLLSFKSHILTGTTAGALVGSVVPIVGPFAGTVLGGVGGTLVYLIRSVTRTHR